MLKIGLALPSGRLNQLMVKDESGEISTGPNANDWLACILGFPMYTAIASILPLLLLQWPYMNTPNGRAPAWAFAGILLFGAAVAAWFTGRLLNRQFWRLTQSELVSGMRGQTRYPLSNIEKIVVGLPGQLPVAGMGVFASPAQLEIFAEKQATTLLLKFNDGAMLPLNLRALANGAALMEELTGRLQERVTRNYTYSDQEIKTLRRADPNALIRKRPGLQ